MKKTHFSKLLMVAFAAATLFLTSCGKDVEPTPAVISFAKVMLYHGATDAAAVNLQVDGVTKNLDSVKYASWTNYFQTQLTGGKKVVVTATEAKSGIKIATDSLLMNKDIGYSFFVFQDNNTAKTLTMIKSVDNLALPTAGNGRVRLVNLIPDAPNGVDVELVAVGGVATTRSDFPAVKFKDIKDFIDIKAGMYDIKVKNAGLTTLAVSLPLTVSILDGKLLTIVARGYTTLAPPKGSNVSVISNN
jgi:Domain of unknown function (DUF4397)